jgi:hypothetical protein
MELEKEKYADIVKKEKTKNEIIYNDEEDKY